MSIEVNNESAVEVDEAALQRLAVYALDAMHVHPDAELAIVLVDEGAMEQLHVQWMDEPGPTDVLSFPMDELRPGTEDQPAPARTARRRRAVPAGRRGAGARPRGIRSSTSCCCSRRTASCTCSASTTPSRPRRRRCSASSATSSSASRCRSDAADHAALALPRRRLRARRLRRPDGGGGCRHRRLQPSGCHGPRARLPCPPLAPRHRRRHRRARERRQLRAHHRRDHGRRARDARVHLRSSTTCGSCCSTRRSS